MPTRGGSTRSASVRRRPTRVEVYDGPRGREFMIDGTFASFYTPGCVTTGSVWDAIAAPILALPPERRQRVLILGLGGGSAARIVRAIAPEAAIVGVEFDAEVVRMARARFDLDDLGLEVVVADAERFLRDERRQFDLILEDVFIGEADGVHKPHWLPRPGHAFALERLAPGGVLVSNTLDEAPAVASSLCRQFPRVVRIEVEDYDNRIFAAGADLSARALRRAVARNDVLGPSVGRLHFRTVC